MAPNRILRYLKGTLELGILYKTGFIAYSDRKITSGYVFMPACGAVSWSSKKQPVVTMSAIEVQFIAALLNGGHSAAIDN